MPNHTVHTTNGRRKWLLRTLLVLFALSFTALTAYALIYTIDTDDGSVAEWANQGVPVFKTDPLDYTVEPQSDIVNTWVATGENNLYFLMEVDAAPALQPSGQNPPPRLGVAALDCDQDGNPQERNDLLIAYAPNEDTVWFLSGDQNQGFPLTSGDDADPTVGQRVGEYIEWSIPLVYLDFYFPPLDWTIDCANAIDIGFVTADASNWPLPSLVLDQTGFMGWNVPTAVGLQTFGATNTDVATVAWVLVAALVVAATAVLVIKRRRQLR